MSEFIVDTAINKVNSSTTKEYLKEVISSYSNGNYRSAIVVLYAVAIFDLVEKLLILRDIYNDENASSIIEKITKMQKDQPTSPQWEESLIEEINKRTSLLDNIQVEKINHLKYYRNICAHPVYNQEYKLINPSREEVLSLIRICCEAIFWKDALLCKDIIATLLHDVSDYYRRVQLNGLENHVKYTYFNRMNQSVKDKVFETFWKLVFLLDNQDCNENRNANLNVLIYLVKEDRNHYKELVLANKDRYSKISLSNNTIEYASYHEREISSPMSALITFLSAFEDYYEALSESGQNIINVEVKNNFFYKVRAIFLSPTLSEHTKMIREEIKSICLKDNGYYWTGGYSVVYQSDFEFLINKGIEKGCKEEIQDFIIKHFLSSPSYASAESIFDRISHLLVDFSKDKIDFLLDGMKEHSQIRDSYQYSKMVNYIEKLNK